MYRDFHFSMEFPTVESKVAHDIHELFTPSKEVLDRLTGNDDIEERIRDILDSYSVYCQQKYQDALAKQIAQMVGDAFTPIVTQFIKNKMGFYPTRVQSAMTSPIKSVGNPTGII